jgi:hypothetical protein
MMNCPFRNTHPRLSHRHSVCCSLPCPPTSPHPQDEQEPPAAGAPSTMRCPRGGSTAFPRWCGRLQLDVERSRVRLIILRRNALDAGSALLAGQPVGLHHPIQRLSPRNWERRSSCDRGHGTGPFEPGHEIGHHILAHGDMDRRSDPAIEPIPEPCCPEFGGPSLRHSGFGCFFTSARPSGEAPLGLYLGPRNRPFAVRPHLHPPPALARPRPAAGAGVLPERLLKRVVRAILGAINAGGARTCRACAVNAEDDVSLCDVQAGARKRPAQPNKKTRMLDDKAAPPTQPIARLFHCLARRKRRLMRASWSGAGIRS